MVRKSRFHNRAQLVLELERPNPEPPVTLGAKGLIETLADLLLEAVGTKEMQQKQGGVNERQDHA
jgi:hypothetical protein